jgi:hypothetical protein
MQGDVSNLRGLVKVDSAAGSIRLEQKVDGNGNLIPGQTATIRAGEVDIKTRNGDFVQSYANAFYHAAGAPLFIEPGDPNLAFPGNIDEIKRNPEQPGAGIIANGSVLIAARYLNINGNIQSGIPEWGVIVPTNATVTVGGNNSATFAQAQAHYNALSAVDKAKAGAEYYSVSGATVNGLTGNVQGNWEKVNVSYNAKENRLELGGVQVQGGYIEIFGQLFNTNQNNGGKLRVLDGYGQIKVDNRTNLALWVNTLDTGRGVKGEINITNITGLDSSGRPIFTTAQYIRDPGDARTGSFYNPAAGQRYVMTVGYDTAKEEYYRYSQSGWFDISATYSSLALDQYRINSIVRSNDPLSQGEFLQVWPSPSGSTAHYFGRTQAETTSSIVSPGRSWKECNWWTLCANARYYQEFSIATGTKTVITDSVRGDYPIGIEFIGFDQGTVDVQSTGNLVLNGSVNNRVGNTRIASTGGSVTQNGDLAMATGTNVSLAAATGIGASTQSVQVNVGGGTLNATSTAGDVRVKQMVGDLKVGTVGGAGVANVVLEAERSLLASNANSYVQGQRVELIARNGGIGELGTVNNPLTVRTGYTANQSQWPNYGLVATARDNINISNVADAANAGVYSGNLLLISAESAAGDVRIQTAGTVIDNNPFAVTDQRSVQELNDLWDSMRLRGTRAAEKADETVASFEKGVTQQYQLYWITRQRQTDSTAYDAGFQFRVSALERTQLTGSGMDAAAITAFETSKTTEYHQLHTRLYGGAASSVKGPVAAGFDSSFRYVADGTERNAIVDGSSWSDSQLALSVGGGLLKDVTDTVTVIKQPNAKGRNVTLVAGTGIGSFDAPLQIDLSQGLNALTAEQKAALAAAERGDATVAGSIITITQPRPVNVEVGTGALVANAGTGRAFIGSEKDLRIDTVTAGSDVRIKATGSLVNAASVAGAPNIVGDSLILESADGGIGSVADTTTGTVSTPLRVRLNSGASFIARAANDIWVEEAGDFNIDTVFSRKDVRLTAAGSIFDFDQSDALNILSDDLTLTAQNGSIGSLLDALDVGVDADGRIRATATGGVYLNGPAGTSFNIGEVRAGTVAGLSADVQMLIDGAVDAAGQVTLTSGGHIAMTQNAAVTANTIGALVEAGTLTMDDGASLHVDLGTIRIVTDGDMRITGIETGNDGINNMNGAPSSIYMESLAGSIFDNGDTRLDIITDTAPAAKLIIRAAGQIGGNPLDVRLLNLESSSGRLTHINEQDSLHVDSAQAGGEFVLRAGMGGNGGSIDADLIQSDTKVNLFAPDRIDAVVTHSATNGPLVANIGGLNGGPAAFVELDMTSPVGIAFGDLSVINGSLRVPNTDITVARASVGERFTVDNLLTFLLIDQKDVNPNFTSDIQLYAPAQPFAFNLADRVLETDASVIHFKDLTHSVISLVPGRNMDLRANIERGLSVVQAQSDEAMDELIANAQGDIVSFDGAPVALPDCSQRPLPEACR